jgi:hypothetical protein
MGCTDMALVLVRTHQSLLVNSLGGSNVQGDTHCRDYLQKGHLNRRLLQQAGQDVCISTITISW